MKTVFPNGVKRALSLLLAFAMLIGCLITANVGINVNADSNVNRIEYWDGTSSNKPSKTADDGALIITTAAEFVWVLKNNVADTTYRVDDGISAFVLQNYDAATAASFMALDSADDVKTWFTNHSPINWNAAGSLKGIIDGNGAAIYGMYCSGVDYAGLFKTAAGNSVFKNFAIKNCYVSGNSFAGVLSGAGNWSSENPILIEGCDVRNNYVDCVAGNKQSGVLISNAGNALVTVRNSLFVGNKVLKESVEYTSNIIYNIDKTIGYVENVIAFGCYPSVGGRNKTKFTNVYSNQSLKNETTDSIGYGTATIYIANASALQGISAKSTAAALPWATDAVNGAGYWHIMADDYPTPIKPDGWKDIYVYPVWNGTEQDFTKGSGTEEDPYIIETAEQLYKMVMDGGRELTGEKKTVKLTKGVTNANGEMLDTSGNVTTDATIQAYEYSDETVEVPVYRACYYKVSPDVTDIYLNNVQGGNLDTLKALVTAGTAKNWNQNYEAAKEKADEDGDGFADEGLAFRGVFDGNGVTIHGLYTTKSKNETSWLAYGDGFFPAIKGDAVIKNVTFDKAYINPSIGYGGVVSSSIGLDSTNNNAQENSNKGLLGDNCSSTNATFANVAVRNAYIAKGGYSTQSGVVDAYSKGGLLAAHGSPKSLSFINCLFDGASSELVYDKNDFTAGLYSTPNTASSVTMVNCVSIGLQPLSCSLNVSLANMINCYTTKPLEKITDNNNPSDDYLKKYIGTNSSRAELYKDYVSDYNENNNLANVKVITEYNSQDDLSLLNWGIWELKTFDGRVIPMPSVTNSSVSGYATVKDMLLELVGGAGMFSYTGTKEKGTYGQYESFTGSGTEKDPYLITNAQQLAIAIAAGGRNITQKLHYKLTCDINLGSILWLDTESVHRLTYKQDPTTKEYILDEQGNKVISEDFDEYKYVAFEGVLDGDGHTIYELNATDTYDENGDGIDDDFGALIPKLNGGTVKNLHIRNSAAKTAIFGVGKGTVENCSAADCYVANQENTLVSGDAKTLNCQFDDKYFDANGEAYTPVLDGKTWYGIDDTKLENNDNTHTPQLVNRAKNMPCADIDGDGEGYTYGANDLAALRNHLLDREGYEYVYGDVSGNGKTNISDLVILVRAMADTYADVDDGFWRNLELGNFTIFYGENDNYDAARKLELYLEAAVSGVDVKKAVSAAKTVSGADSDKTAVYVHENDIIKNPDGQLEIIVGNIANSNYATNTKATAENSYAITYDNANGVLWLQGENFTGVEQAVLDFIEKSDAATASVYTVDSAELSDEKKPVIIDMDSNANTTDDRIYYYYAWGDEFNGIENFDENGTGTGISDDTWLHGQMSTETGIEDGLVDYPKYYNLEYALNKDLSALYDVKDGKLSMKRGVYGESVGSQADQLGYALLENPIVNGEAVTNEAGGIIDGDGSDKFVTSGKIDSEKSLLVKQGYFEFKASLPSDGHSFPSWWMIGKASGGNNGGISTSLYSKIYKLNPYYYGLDSSYTGDKNSIKSNDPKTYKYQLPNSYFEIDIIELMQNVDGNVPTKNIYSQKNNEGTILTKKQSDWTKGVYDYDLTFNIHKFFDTGLVDGKYYLIDWDNYTGQANYNAGIGYEAKGSDNSQDGIFSSSLGYYDFGNVTSTGYDGFKKYTDDKGDDDDDMYDTMQYSEKGHTNLTYERRYGFLWQVDSENKTFDFTIYIWNPNPYKDNAPDSYYKISFSDITYNEQSQLSALNNALPDAEIANQYLYFIIDNLYYTNNEYYGTNSSGKNVVLFEDLLTVDNSMKKKTTLDIDYLRVYQAEGRRDIVTPETENFNNNNHFGY